MESLEDEKVFLVEWLFKRMNITLIGMPGVGKSFIGKKLAKELGYKFIDVDDLIEEREGEKLQNVLDKLGDEKFIELEGKTILSLKGEGMVLAPGGSVVYSSSAMKYLNKISKIFYLKDGMKSIKKRIPNINSRGIVGLKNKTFEELFREREKLYLKYADFVVYVGDFDEERIVRDILNAAK